MTLNAVVFDLDGVITDTAHLHFLASARRGGGDWYHLRRSI